MNNHMGIDMIKDVIIDADGGHKFIVVIIQDRLNNEKMVIRADKNCGCHYDILATLKDELRNKFKVSIKCIGGGFITASSADKMILIEGRSGDYGIEPDREKTVEILQKSFPGFQIFNRK